MPEATKLGIAFQKEHALREAMDSALQEIGGLRTEVDECRKRIASDEEAKASSKRLEESATHAP